MPPPCDIDTCTEPATHLVQGCPDDVALCDEHLELVCEGCEGGIDGLDIYIVPTCPLHGFRTYRTVVPIEPDTEPDTAEGDCGCPD